MPANPQCWSRQALPLHHPVMLVPDDVAVAQGIREERGQSETLHGAGIQPGDELATHSVAWIAVRFKHCHRYAAALQCEAQTEAGHSATDDLDRLAGPADHSGIGFVPRIQAVK